MPADNRSAEGGGNLNADNAGFTVRRKRDLQRISRRLTSPVGQVGQNITSGQRLQCPSQLLVGQTGVEFAHVLRRRNARRSGGGLHNVAMMEQHDMIAHERCARKTHQGDEHGREPDRAGPGVVEKTAQPRDPGPAAEAARCSVPHPHDGSPGILSPRTGRI